mgnify:CR=1 FL=1
MIDIDSMLLDTDSLLKELDYLLLELEAETFFVRKKPEEIMNNPDFVERKKEEQRFQVLNEMFIFPLKEFADRISSKMGQPLFDVYQLEGLSIAERLLKLRSYLVARGCTVEMMNRLIPKTEQECDLLLNARKMGFSLGFEQNQSLDNEDRILRASNYLESLSVSDSTLDISQDEDSKSSGNFR